MEPRFDLVSGLVLFRVGIQGPRFVQDLLLLAEAQGGSMLCMFMGEATVSDSMLHTQRRFQSQIKSCSRKPSDG